MPTRKPIPDYLLRYGPPHRAIERRVIPTGGPGLRLRFYPGVDDRLRDQLKEFAQWLRRELEFLHPVQVTVVAQATVMGLDGAPGWAVFLIPPPEYMVGDLVRIYMAGGKLAILEGEYGYSQKEALTLLCQVLAHEIAHYEQWRDGHEISEDGVSERAELIVSTYQERARAVS